MSNSDLKGRSVTFVFDEGHRVRGTVEYGPPCATGDAWIIADSQTPELKTYVQSYNYMLLYPEPPEDSHE